MADAPELVGAAANHLAAAPTLAFAFSADHGSLIPVVSLQRHSTDSVCSSGTSPQLGARPP
jgi:hypothetical protein